MAFVLDNCAAQIVLKRGRVFHSRNVMLNIYGEIQELEGGETCRYLGTGESGSKEHQQMKEKLKKGIHLEVKNGIEIGVECEE